MDFHPTSTHSFYQCLLFLASGVLKPSLAALSSNSFPVILAWAGWSGLTHLLLISNKIHLADDSETLFAQFLAKGNDLLFVINFTFIYKNKYTNKINYNKWTSSLEILFDLIKSTNPVFKVLFQCQRLYREVIVRDHPHPSGVFPLVGKYLKFPYFRCATRGSPGPMVDSRLMKTEYIFIGHTQNLVFSNPMPYLLCCQASSIEVLIVCKVFIEYLY